MRIDIKTGVFTLLIIVLLFLGVITFVVWTQGIIEYLPALIISILCFSGAYFFYKKITKYREIQIIEIFKKYKTAVITAIVGICFMIWLVSYSLNNPPTDDKKSSQDVQKSNQITSENKNSSQNSDIQEHKDKNLQEKKDMKTPIYKAFEKHLDNGDFYYSDLDVFYNNQIPGYTLKLTYNLDDPQSMYFIANILNHSKSNFTTVRKNQKILVRQIGKTCFKILKGYKDISSKDYVASGCDIFFISKGHNMYMGSAFINKKSKISYLFPPP